MDTINRVKWKEDYILFSELSVEEKKEFGQQLQTTAFKTIGYVCEEKKVLGE